MTTAKQKKNKKHFFLLKCDSKNQYNPPKIEMISKKYLNPISVKRNLDT
jgi:hypothetical protein